MRPNRSTVHRASSWNTKRDDPIRVDRLSASRNDCISSVLLDHIPVQNILSIPFRRLRCNVAEYAAYISLSDHTVSGTAHETL